MFMVALDASSKSQTMRRRFREEADIAARSKGAGPMRSRRIPGNPDFINISRISHKSLGKKVEDAGFVLDFSQYNQFGTTDGRLRKEFENWLWKS
jgi:hypothetical protein